MRRWIADLAPALFLLLFLRPAEAIADGVSAEWGPGVAHSRCTFAVFLRYERDAPALFGQAGFYEASYGSWSGPNRNEAAALARGLLWPAGKRGYLSFAAGLGLVRRKTENLDTPLEILLRAAYGLRAGRFDISLGFTHFSNGKKLFRGIHPAWWDHGPNYGEYFPSIRVGVSF